MNRVMYHYVYSPALVGHPLGGVHPTGGLACRAKWTHPSYQNFSGNGIAVAAMCAVRHQYRPVAANEGGLTGKVDISLEMGPVGDSWETWCPPDVHRKSPTSL